MQAIQTRFLPPTNSRGSRIKASAYAGNVTISWKHAIGIEENHEAAALALAKKLGWGADRWVGGSLPKSGYAFVRVID